MRKLFIAAVAGLAACAALAAGDRQILTLTTGSTATSLVSTTTSTLRGYIDEINFDVVTAGTTGDLALVTAPEGGTLSSVTLATATACAADATFRPRYTPTGISGGTATNNPAYTVVPYLCVGETLTFSCVNATATSRVFRCIIKFEK